MTVHLHRAIEALKGRILDLGSLVENRLFSAVKSIETADQALALEIVSGDEAVDQMEVEVEEECLKMLALHQPVAADLRFIVAVLKINNDLERIGDLAVNIASRANSLLKISSPGKAVIDLQNVQAKVQKMLRGALESLVNLDGETARQVCAADREVDDINRSVHKQVIDGIKAHPDEVERLILYLSVSRNLERIADHATNIAEDVLYMISGQIVRHTYVAPN